MRAGIAQEAAQATKHQEQQWTMQSPRTNQGRSDIGCWDSDVYDYGRLVITDPAAAEVDLRYGWWIRCICCRGRKFKMRNPFDTRSWDEHKQTQSHLSGAAKLGIASSHNDALLKRRNPSQSLRVRVKELPDGEFAFCAKPFQAEVRKQARGDQDTLVKVINSLSYLVSEQQDDIQELRAKLREMHHHMTQMTSAFEDVQHSQHELSQSVCSYLEEVASQPSQTQSLGKRGRRSRTYDLRSQQSEGYDTEDTDKSFTDMSVFEDQSELTEME